MDNLNDVSYELLFVEESAIDNPKRMWDPDTNCVSVTKDVVSTDQITIPMERFPTIVESRLPKSIFSLKLIVICFAVTGCFDP